MNTNPRLDILGAALADPSRVRILCELMDGRAFTNKELACAACITPQTASAHLKSLESAGFTSHERSGRHVYHRIKNAEVAEVLERMAHLSPTHHLARNTSAGQDVRAARTCYNHMAGRLGVAIKERLEALEVVAIHEEMAKLGARFAEFANANGLDADAIARAKTPVKLCLDWTERKPHLQGAFAIALLQKALTEQWLTRADGSRALVMTYAGRQGFATMLDLPEEQLAAI